MNYWTINLCSLCLALLAGCSTGVRDIDFMSKKFVATYNVDSTKGIDSTNMASLMGSRSVFDFNEDGKGTNHIQMGMLSKDTPFTWKIQQDSLFIDQKRYAVEKGVKEFVIRSDSAKIILTQQP